MATFVAILIAGMFCSARTLVLRSDREPAKIFGREVVKEICGSVEPYH
jgi:hypothetical protein